MGLNPVCVRCGREMTCEKNGVLVVHYFEHADLGPIKEGNVIYIDRLMEGSWKDGDIDFIAEGDKWTCLGCGSSVVMRFGEIMSAANFSQEQLKRIAEGYDEAITIRRGGLR